MNRKAVASCDKKLRTVNKLVYVLETRPPARIRTQIFQPSGEDPAADVHLPALAAASQGGSASFSCCRSESPS